MIRLPIKAGISAGAIAAVLACPAIATAQDTSATSAAGSANNVIIVTARNKEENLQDVPLAITAFGEEQIDRLGLQELDDVARFTPGFSFEDFSGGFAVPVIRGQAQTRVTALESNVSTFYDGLYIPRSWAVDIGTSNISRVEVVKGPQSARYGRNAFSGAINYVPRKAVMDGAISGEIEGTVGIDERYDIGGFVNASLNDRMAVAAGVNFSTFDGSWENSHPNADIDFAGPSTEGNVGGWDNASVYINAMAEPVDGLIFDFSYNYSEIQNEARASRYIGETAGGILDPSAISATDNGLRGITNCGVERFGVPAFICGDLPDPADTTINDPRGFAVNSETDIFRAAVSYEISDSSTISYTFGLIDGTVDIGTSGEPDPINCGTLVASFGGLCNFQVTPVGDINYKSHEVRVTWDAGTGFTGAVGAFYSDGVDNNTFVSVNIAPIDPADPLPFNGNNGPGVNPAVPQLNILLADERTETETKALFGEILWTSDDGLTRIGAEARYSHTDITGIDNRRAITLNEVFEEFTPRFTIERDLSDDVLIYGTVARGAKAGGFNPTARSSADFTFDPEYNWTYEAGLKGTLADGRVIFNAAVYYTDWTDIQINAADFDPANPTNPNVPTITKNLGNAELYGIELSANVLVTDEISIDATFSHTEGEYAEGTADSRFSRGAPGTTVPCDNIVCNANGDISGNEIERSTPTQASAGIQWEGDVSGNATAFIRADASWQADFFADSANLGVIPERFLVNAAAGVTLNDTISIRIWARNLLDKKYTSNAFAVLLPFGNTYGQFYGERRTAGVTASLEF